LDPVLEKERIRGWVGFLMTFSSSLGDYFLGVGTYVVVPRIPDGFKFRPPKCGTTEAERQREFSFHGADNRTLRLPSTVSSSLRGRKREGRLHLRGQLSVRNRIFSRKNGHAPLSLLLLANLRLLSWAMSRILSHWCVGYEMVSIIFDSEIILRRRLTSEKGR